MQQPQFQLLRAVEYAIQRIESDAAEGDQLDDRLEGNREHQPFMLLAGSDVPGAEENREQRDQGAETQGHAMLHRLAGEDADGIGHRLNLQGQKRQHTDQHENRGQRTGPGAAEAKREQVGQGRQLISAGDLQDRIQQHRCQQESAGHTEVAGQEAITVLIRQAHGAIKRPGTGIDAQRQGVGERVANDRPGDHAPFTDPGHTEQHRQVRGADQDHLGQAKAHRHLFGSAG
ncbi:hypothetical protein D3C71_585410 [compost metagenome]